MADGSTEVWATALIKWAEDIDSLRQKEAELAAIHTEYSSLQSKHAQLQQQLLPYRQQIQTLLQGRVQQTSSAPSAHHSRPLSSVENNGMEVTASSRLNEAEVGLDKAKEEYHKIKQELSTCHAQITTLASERDYLRTQVSYFQTLSEQLSNKLKTQANEILPVVLDNEPLRGQVASSHSSSASTVAFGTEEYVNELRTQVCCLREEIETLKHDSKSRSMENQGLRKQLAAVQENLQKAKGSNKMLSSTMNNLHSIVGARHKS